MRRIYIFTYLLTSPCSHLSVLFLCGDSFLENLSHSDNGHCLMSANTLLTDETDWNTGKPAQSRQYSASIPGQAGDAKNPIDLESSRPAEKRVFGWFRCCCRCLRRSQLPRLQKPRLRCHVTEKHRPTTRTTTNHNNNVKTQRRQHKDCFETPTAAAM